MSETSTTNAESTAPKAAKTDAKTATKSTTKATVAKTKASKAAPKAKKIADAEAKPVAKKLPISEVKGTYFYGVGRRKACTARAKIYPGSEFSIVVDGKDINDYFPEFYRLIVENMITHTGYKQGAIRLFVRGGGLMAQAEASRLAIAKALLKMDEGFRPVLRMYGYLTTDIRKVLPKRPGLRKARKREQWSKR